MVDLKLVEPKDFWYVVGLIVTDGNLSKDGRHIDITSKEISHLEKVANALFFKNPIASKYSGRNREKTYFRLQFSDAKLYRYLQNIGITPRKSLTLRDIKINERYFRDFLRGVIDGDGSICVWKHRTNGHQQWSLRIVSAAPIFSKWIKEEIETHYKVRGRLHVRAHDEKRNNLHIIKFGKLAAKVILSDIYYKGALFLDSKHKRHLECLQDESKMIKYGEVLRARVS